MDKIDILGQKIRLSRTNAIVDIWEKISITKKKKKRGCFQALGKMNNFKRKPIPRYGLIKLFLIKNNPKGINRLTEKIFFFNWLGLHF